MLRFLYTRLRCPLFPLMTLTADDLLPAPDLLGAIGSAMTASGDRHSKPVKEVLITSARNNV